MKKTITFGFLLFMGCFTQAQVVRYTYDAAGNRITRRTTAMRSGEFETPKDTIVSHKVGVFPNPTQDVLNVNIDGYEESTKVSMQLFDMNGRLIRTIPVAGASNTLDLYNEAAGSYLLKVFINDKMNVWRVVKSQ